MPDKPPKLEIDTKPFNGADYEKPPIEEATEEEKKVQQMIAEAIKYAEDHNLSGEKIEKTPIQERQGQEKLAEVLPENFKKFVEKHVIDLLMTALWTQTTRGITNNPEDKETEHFLNETINEAQEILGKIFKDHTLTRMERKYIMDGLYEKLKEKNIIEPFKNPLRKFFKRVFLGELPTDFKDDEK